MSNIFFLLSVLALIFINLKVAQYLLLLSVLFALWNVADALKKGEWL